MSKLVQVEGGELSVRAAGTEVEFIAERQMDVFGPAMKFRLVLDADSADQLATDILRAATQARR